MDIKETLQNHIDRIDRGIQTAKEQKWEQGALVAATLMQAKSTALMALATIEGIEQGACVYDESETVIGFTLDSETDPDEEDTDFTELKLAAKEAHKFGMTMDEVGAALKSFGNGLSKST